MTWRYVLLTLLAGGCGRPPYEPPAVDPAWTPGPGETLVTIRSPVALGGYLLEVVFDPGILVLTGVRGGVAVGFEDAPATDRRAYGSGRIRVAGVARAMAGPGDVRVARLAFDAAGGEAAEGSVHVRLIEAVDSEGRPVAGASVDPGDPTVVRPPSATGPRRSRIGSAPP